MKRKRKTCAWGLSLTSPRKSRDRTSDCDWGQRLVQWSESDYSQKTAARFARAGVLVRVAAADDACEVCQARARGVYAPSEVPRLPIRGCLRDHCRCRFVAVDPETELTIPQLVQRGVYALKAGRKELAEQILRQAVALDEMYELGWLWLSAVADNRAKIACLEKVLEINPQNQRAQVGLEALQRELKELETEPEPEAVQPVLPEEKAEESQSSKELPLDVVAVREERQVILEEWADFLSIADQIDSTTLVMQGQAFLKQIERLSQQTVDALPPDMHLEELLLQWGDSQVMGEALANVLEAHRDKSTNTTDWQAIHEAIRHLAQHLLGHRRGLRKQIGAVGGEIPED